MGSDRVTFIDGTQVEGTLGVGNEPEAVAFCQENGYLYVTNYDSNTVTVIDGSTNQLVTSFPVGDHPYGIVYQSLQRESLRRQFWFWDRLCNRDR